jgi:PAS domain-containing protein
MKSLRPFAELATVGLLLLGATIWQSTQLKQGLDREQKLGVHRLERAFVPLLEKAHRLKDDLALQAAISALAQAPGVGSVCVIDLDRRIIAHNRLAEVGKTLSNARLNRAESVPLKDGSTVWGSFIFSLSSRLTLSLWHAWFMREAVILLVLFGAFAVSTGGRIRENAMVHRLLNDQKIMTEDHIQEAARWRNQFEETKVAHAQALAVLIARESKPLLLLDHQQNVLAMNDAARFKVSAYENFIGKSWQTVPWLQDQGAVLEASLKSGGQPIRAEQVSFRTENGVTWVEWDYAQTSSSCVSMTALRVG